MKPQRKKPKPAAKAPSRQVPKPQAKLPDDADIDAHLQRQLNGLALQQELLELAVRAKGRFDERLCSRQERLARASGALGAEVRQRAKYIRHLAEHLTAEEKLAVLRPFIDQLESEHLMSLKGYVDARVESMEDPS